MKSLALVAAAVLLLLGGDGLFQALRGREQVDLRCDEFARARPSSHRVLVTGCEIDYAGAGYRESGGQVQEIYLPMRPRGRALPAPLVAATRNPHALAALNAVIASGQPLPPQQSRAAMEKVAELLQVTDAIDGLVRAGLVERLRSRRILSGLVTPLDDDVVILDIGGRPDFMRPLLAITAGVLLAMVPVVRRKAWSVSNRNTSPSPAGTVSANQLADLGGEDAATRVELPKLLLLNLDAQAAPDAIETAPPLGSRQDVVQILSAVIPDLHGTDQSRILTRADGSIALDLGTEDPIAAVVVDARGEPGVALVKELLLMTGWRAFAPKTGLFVSADDLSALGALAT